MVNRRLPHAGNLEARGCWPCRPSLSGRGFPLAGGLDDRSEAGPPFPVSSSPAALSLVITVTVQPSLLPTLPRFSFLESTAVSLHEFSDWFGVGRLN